VIHYVGILEMSIINVIFLTNVEKLPIFLVTQLLKNVPALVEGAIKNNSVNNFFAVSVCCLLHLCKVSYIGPI